MKIKMIMCDVDGTLLDDDGYVSAYTIQKIKEVKAKGILFGLCTGRDADSVKTLLQTWGIDGLVDVVIGSGGAEICDFKLSVDKANYPLDGNLIKEIMQHYNDMDVNFAIPHEGILFAPKDDTYIQMLAHFDKVPYQVTDFDEFLKESKMKLMIVCDESYMDKVIERSRSFHNDQYKCSSLKTASVLYEYMDPRVSKTNGLREVVEMHGLTMEELCVFGDADNDFDMVKNAGVGIVMANGSEKTKSVASFLTNEDNNHDGVGKFLKVMLEGHIDVEL